jgi:ATP:ADP antiporter, AAA family
MDEQPSLKSFPSFKALELQPKGPVEKVLSYFADVRAGEGVTALLLSLNVFLLLGAYYLLKTVRESLILTEGGAEVKSYSAAGQALLLLLVVPAYGAFASRVSRIRLIAGVTLFFISHLAIFYLLGTQGVKEGVVYYLWVGIFNVLIVAQFWAFANDLYTEAQGKRLFPIIGVGSSLGAWLGADAAGHIIKTVGPYSLMWIAALLLLACVALTYVVHVRESARQKDPKKAEAPLQGGESGFALVLKDRYLLLIAVLTVLLNLVNSSGEFLLGKVVTDEAAKLPLADQKKFVGGFYGEFFSIVNLTGFLLQSFVVSRVFHFVGVRGALYILPSIALGTYSVLFTYPILALVRIGKIAENSVDYSIQNTTRQALFLPTSREAKYKAKAAIDTFFMRAGDVLQAGVVWLGTRFALSLTAYAFLNVCLTLCWLGVVYAIGREHRRRVRPSAAIRSGSRYSGSTQAAGQ